MMVLIDRRGGSLEQPLRVGVRYACAVTRCESSHLRSVNALPAGLSPHQMAGVECSLKLQLLADLPNTETVRLRLKFATGYGYSRLQGHLSL